MTFVYRISGSGATHELVCACGGELRVRRTHKPCDAGRITRLVHGTHAFTSMVILLLAWAFIGALPLATAHAQSPSHSHSLLIWPSGAVAFPTGRFAEKDEMINPAKDGSKTGYNGGLSVGYLLSPPIAVGLAFDYGRFNLDLVQVGGRRGYTSVTMVSAWVRYFLAGGYRRWQPYICLEAGLGRPKGRLEYDPAVQFSGIPGRTKILESTVSTAAAITGGIGVLVPVSNRISLSFEPRFREVSSKGAGRTEKLTQVDGSVVESTTDPSGSRIRAKSNTNWWELRAGVVISLL